MDINVQKEHQMELHCEILKWGAIVLMVVLLVCAAVIAKRIATIISKGISKPLSEVESRFGSFAEGDIHTPFPTSTAKDEIAGLMNASHAMAERLQMIIRDIEHLCAEMSAGNFNVESECPDAYKGDLEGLFVSIKEMNLNVSAALREVEAVSNQVNSGATNLAEAAQSLAEGATDQAASVQEMLATMNTVSDGLKMTAETSVLNNNYLDKLLQQIESGAQVYDDIGSGFGFQGVNVGGSRLCWSLCIANLLCNMCGGRFFFCI
jgi:methyl-accepting chemotaxis protein